MVYILARAVRGGAAHGIASVLGTASGVALYVTLTALGLMAVFAAVPWLHVALRWAGVAFMWFLAADLARRAWRARVTPGTLNLTPQPDLPGPLWRSWAGGLALEASKPTTVYFYTAMLPQFLDATRGPLGPQIWVLGALAVLVNTTVYSALVGVVTAGRGRLSGVGPWLAWIYAGLAVVFAAYGAGFALSALGLWGP
jgi:threonine/homoserine/homoserine lactone efflux protein